MKISNNKGFTIIELMLASAIGVMVISLVISSFLLSIKAIATSTDALLLQREADQILNMKIAPEIRQIRDITLAGQNSLYFQYIHPETGQLVTNGFEFEEEVFYFIQNGEGEAIGRFVQDVKFSYRDGGNNLLYMDDNGFVVDISAVEIVDIRLTVGQDEQIYQVTNSFVPIRRFI